MQSQDFKINEKTEEQLQKMLENTESKTTTPESYSAQIPETVEQIPETAPERKIEIQEKEGFVDDAINNLKNRLRRSKKAQVQIPQVRDDITIKVEKIMEEGLQDAYKELTPIQKQEFKIKGEYTAMEIRKIMQSGKIKVKKIFQLLLEWLRLLPGVNKFFLEQEAKIKADKIIALKDLDNFK